MIQEYNTLAWINVCSHMFVYMCYVHVCALESLYYYISCLCLYVCLFVCVCVHAALQNENTSLKVELSELRGKYSIV